MTELLLTCKTKRKYYLKKFICVAEELYNLRNFHTLMALVAGLSTTLIERLDVWKVNLPPVHFPFSRCWFVLIFCLDFE